MNLVTRGMRQSMLVTRGFMPRPAPLPSGALCLVDASLSLNLGDRSHRLSISDEAYTLRLSDSKAPC